MLSRLIEKVKSTIKPKKRVVVYRGYRVIVLPNGKRIAVKEVISVDSDRIVVRDVNDRIRVIKL